MRENRTIKFRGMGLNGEWSYGLLAYTENQRVACGDTGYFISNKVGSPFAYQVRPETVGEFTGLKDHKGKEIYEGDIVSWDYGKGIAESVVSFVNGRFCVEVSDEITENVHYSVWQYVDEDDFKVIGNIYENKELLEREG